MSWLRENLGGSSLEIQVYTYLALYLICRCRTTKCSDEKWMRSKGVIQNSNVLVFDHSYFRLP
jgi:hypothetical protein